MAQPIALEIPPRDPAAELRSRLETAPAEHAEALLAAYDLLQTLHDQGALDILRGAVGAKEKILQTAVSAVNNPEGIRAIRNLLILKSALGNIEPERLKSLLQAIPEAQAKTSPDRPIGLWGILRRLRSRDSLRALSVAVDFLEAFGRRLRSGADASQS